MSATGRDTEAAVRRLQERLQRTLGSRRVRVEADGSEGEIAVLRVPPGLTAKLLEPSTRARAVQLARAEGFRYAALDLGMEEGPLDPLAGRGGDLA